MFRSGLLALTLLLAATACGGGDGGGVGGGVGGDRLSAAEYRQEANAICAETQERLDAVSLEGGDVAGYFEETIPIAEDRRDRLDDLRPPEDLEETHDQIVEWLSDVIDAADDLREASESGNSEELQAATARGREHQLDLDDAAEELGLSSCSS